MPHHTAIPIRVTLPNGEQHEFESAGQAAKWLGKAWTSARVKKQAMLYRPIHSGPRAGAWVTFAIAL